MALASDVFVEKMVKDSAGRPKLVLEEPKVVTRGDRLVFVLKYRNRSNTPAANFVVTNPLPNTVVFQDSPTGNLLVSVDGGRSWGPLPALTVKDRTGARRLAMNTDVTHVRWTFARPIPAGSTGKLMFRGVVR